jgi:hypothetical protein
MQNAAQHSFPTGFLQLSPTIAWQDNQLIPRFHLSGDLVVAEPRRLQ